MKKILLLVALTLGVGSIAHAGLFDDTVDAEESAEALIHCAREAKSLMPTGEESLGRVDAQHTHVSDSVDTKSYTFNTFSGGQMFGPPSKRVATLVVTVTVTQPDPSHVDAPASLTWSCKLGK